MGVVSSCALRNLSKWSAWFRDARYHDLREPPVRMAYFAYQQGATTLDRMHFGIQAARDAAALAPEIRGLMRELAREVPVVD